MLCPKAYLKEYRIPNFKANRTHSAQSFTKYISIHQYGFYVRVRNLIKIEGFCSSKCFDFAVSNQKESLLILNCIYRGILLWYVLWSSRPNQKTQSLRLKKINALSQSSWQIGRPDLNAFFEHPPPPSSRRVRFESVTALKCGTWFLNEQDTEQRQNTELKKYVVQSVSLCLPYLFLYILTSKS